MTAPRMWHTALGGNVEDAVKYGLTLKASCGIVWTPTRVASDRNRAEFPECPDCNNGNPSRVPGRPHYVYRCYSADARLIYVGCTVFPRTRLEQHRISSWWADQIERVTYTVFPNKEYALYMERRAIESENPRWNIRHRNRTTWTLDDYRDWHTASTFNGAKEKRLESIRAEAKLHFGVDITDPEEQTA